MFERNAKYSKGNEAVPRRVESAAHVASLGVPEFVPTLGMEGLRRIADIEGSDPRNPLNTLTYGSLR